MAAWLGSPLLQGVGTPTERAVDRGHCDPSALARGLCCETLAGPARGAQVCDFTPEVDSSSTTLRG